MTDSNDNNNIDYLNSPFSYNNMVEEQGQINNSNILSMISLNSIGNTYNIFENNNPVQRENYSQDFFNEGNISEDYFKNSEIDKNYLSFTEPLIKNYFNIDDNESITLQNNNIQKENNENEFRQNNNNIIKKSPKFKVFIKANQTYIPKFTVEKYIIHFKRRFGQWFIKIINDILKKEKKRKKFYRFDTKKFTSIGTITRNRFFLSKKCIDLLDYSSQKKRNNKYVIEAIKKHPKRYGEELWYYLKLTFEKCIIEFYHSETFINFKNEEKTKKYDNEFYKLYKISFINEEGFTEFIKKKKGNLTYKQKKIKNNIFKVN